MSTRQRAAVRERAIPLTNFGGGDPPLAAAAASMTSDSNFGRQISGSRPTRTAIQCQSRGTSARSACSNSPGHLIRRRMPSAALVILIVALSAICRTAAAHVATTEDDEDVVDDEFGILSNDVQLPGPLQHVVTVVKGKVDLPCDIEPPIEDDQASLVLWYKNDGSPSIYTYDARGRLAKTPRHWSDETVFGRSAYFNALLKPAALSIDNVRESDAGLYRCRVDFKKSPTRNSRVNLTVIVPPKQMRIVDEKGQEVDDVIGPYDEDSTLQLVCLVIGGNPAPEVTWWQEQRLIDRLPDHSSGEGVRNLLKLERLGRPDLRTTISCQAANTQLSHPLTKSAVIELNLRPLEVKILSSKQPMSANKKYELTCQTFGSRPSATVTWWKDGVLLRRSQETVFDGGNRTLSQLSLQLTPEDDGRRLVCRTENPQLGPASAIEDSMVLEVYYVPSVRLELGRNLDNDNIREGTDVYFDCHVVARPSAVRLVWRHQGNVLQHNVSAGVIISNSSLVLQRVSRTAAGRYTCHASNAEGEGASAAFNLNVMHKPACRAEQRDAYGGTKGLASEVECRVEAKPAVTSFRWAFNGTGEPVDIASGYRTTADGSISILRYTPRSELDFGTLLCWATNPMGTQSQPCVYHFYAAGVPEPPSNCSITNQTASSFEIDCNEGYDGGIPQHFKMHVFDIKTRTLLANLTSSSPKFALHLGGSMASGHSGSGGINGMLGQNDSPRTHSWKSNAVGEDADLRNGIRRPGNGVYGSIAVIPPVGTLLQLTAVNAHGTSDAIFLEATSVPGLPAEMQTSGVSNFEFSPTLGILIGIVATGVLLMVALMTGIRFRCRKPAQPEVKSPAKAKTEYIELGTKDPDIIAQDKAGDNLAHITSNPLEYLNNSNSVGVTANRSTGGDDSATVGRSSTLSTLPLSDHHRNLSSQEEIVYAELTLPRKAPPLLASNVSSGQNGEPEPVVYAQIDHSRKMKRGAKGIEANYLHHGVHLPDINQMVALSSELPIRETALT